MVEELLSLVNIVDEVSMCGLGETASRLPTLTLTPF